MFLLIRILKDITFNFESHKHQAHVLHDVPAAFCAFILPRDVNTPNFLELLKAKVSVVEHFGREWGGGVIGTDPGLVKSEYQQVAVEPDNPTYVKKRILEVE